MELLILVQNLALQEFVVVGGVLKILLTLLSSSAPTGLSQPLPIHQDPEVGQSNFAYVLVRNRGTQPAYNVHVFITTIKMRGIYYDNSSR
ncbi:hypothetical protein THII_1557 [Thioploca ingrica]|uniref:Uncharacterized protein n=1 Tax=Thioploca ingrica TaxID=40754 RepID=A0A090AFM7_9GAMM|nr:hypothetical protein THII_1557 [Thioploca ingrica]